MQTLQQEKIKTAVDTKKKQLVDAAVKHGGDIAAVAKESGLNVQPVGDWVTASQAKTAQMPEALQKVLFDAKTISDKKVSEPIDVGQNTYWVVQVKEVRPEAQLTLEQAKAGVKEAVLMSEGGKLAAAAAKEALAKLQKGEKIWINLSGCDSGMAEALIEEVYKVGGMRTIDVASQ